MGSLTGRMPPDYSNGPVLTPTALFPHPLPLSRRAGRECGVEKVCSELDRAGGAWRSTKLGYLRAELMLAKMASMAKVVKVLKVLNF
jgi:hypothetical protein